MATELDRKKLEELLTSKLTNVGNKYSGTWGLTDTGLPYYQVSDIKDVAEVKNFFKQLVGGKAPYQDLQKKEDGGYKTSNLIIITQAGLEAINQHAAQIKKNEMPPSRGTIINSPTAISRSPSLGKQRFVSQSQKREIDKVKLCTLLNDKFNEKFGTRDNGNLRFEIERKNNKDVIVFNAGSERDSINLLASIKQLLVKDVNGDSVVKSVADKKQMLYLDNNDSALQRIVSSYGWDQLFPLKSSKASTPESTTSSTSSYSALPAAEDLHRHHSLSSNSDVSTDSDSTIEQGDLSNEINHEADAAFAKLVAEEDEFGLPKNFLDGIDDMPSLDDDEPKTPQPK